MPLVEAEISLHFSTDMETPILSLISLLFVTEEHYHNKHILRKVLPHPDFEPFDFTIFPLLNMHHFSLFSSFCFPVRLQHHLGQDHLLALC